ncbi:AzlD domain-containing protein [Aeromicrobium sp. UC242_57]|uniref:AzlD domain-containing protein n=1 Tax=Aeromicrobium sp. UC242_57 TaxID=3374624 RepID=UPI0037A4A68B
MSPTIWWTIAGCTVVTIAIKAVGPVALGGRDLPPRLNGMIAMMAPALLAALVVTNALADGDTWQIGANTAGVAAGGLVLLLRRQVLLAVVVAVAVTAAIRYLS